MERKPPMKIFIISYLSEGFMGGIAPRLGYEIARDEKIAIRRLRKRVAEENDDDPLFKVLSIASFTRRESDQLISEAEAEEKAKELNLVLYEEPVSKTSQLMQKIIEKKDKKKYDKIKNQFNEFEQRLIEEELKK